MDSKDEKKKRHYLHLFKKEKQRKSRNILGSRAMLQTGNPIRRLDCSDHFKNLGFSLSL